MSKIINICLTNANSETQTKKQEMHFMFKLWFWIQTQPCNVLHSLPHYFWLLLLSIEISFLENNVQVTLDNTKASLWSFCSDYF